MNCPHCGFRFRALAVNAETLPDLAPVVCESCAEVSLLHNRAIRPLAPAELEELKRAPVWDAFIVPALKIINAEREKRS